MSLHLCFIIPVYNHAAEASMLIDRLQPFGHQVILVNDASEPVQTEVLRRLAAGRGWVHLVEHHKNGGKGAAVKTGLKEAVARGFTHALQIDADGQHDTADVPKLISLAQQHPSAVIAGQPIFDDSIPRSRLFARYLTHVWVWVETLSFVIRDSMCGFRIYPLTSVAQLLHTSHLGSRMDFDPEILVRLYWMGVEVISMPTRVTYPEGGKSHFRMVEDNLLITRMHTRLFFGMLWRAPMLLSRKPSIGAPSRSGESER
ncbi:glycosyltransferase family 2 protein [Pelagibius sp. 7325]|uniref:glycosyltransferase family 2 protein n=1 Tax=Pelagibius sp. 7325 TaxID=3131994 RepID=UPI0030EDD09F